MISTWLPHRNEKRNSTKIIYLFFSLSDNLKNKSRPWLCAQKNPFDSFFRAAKKTHEEQSVAKTNFNKSRAKRLDKEENCVCKRIRVITESVSCFSK